VKTQEPDSAKVKGSLFLGFVFLLIVGATVPPRLWLSLDGAVVSSVDEPYRGAPRYDTRYRLRGRDGHLIDYTAGPTDGDLDRSIAVGSAIRKARGELGYSVDGRWRGFSWQAYALVFVLSLACFGRAAFYGWRIIYPKS
jgi:hypothetical protein